ncbi:MAG: restriction endonuclease subunit S [Flammeovirgaceae bacterium]
MKNSFMEKNLKNVEWSEFEIGDLFKIENCKCSNVSLLQNGNIPYIGATNRNNGVLKFVKPVEKLITKGNCIAFICDGEGSVGYSIYKAEDFIGSTTVKTGRSKNLNKYTGHFITTIADTVRSKYSFGFKRNEVHLKKEKILLPATPQGEPDYAFMDEFMKEIEQRKLKKYRDYLVKRINHVKDFKPVPSIKEKDWGEFYINEIFTDIQRGSRLKKDDHKKGNMPYVSSTAMNNGVDSFVGNKDQIRIFNNCLTIANSGSVGATFYQPFSFVASDHITKLANENFNEFIYIFISNITKRVSEKYSFNREINDQRIKKEKILLPINNQSQPDYQYMENYIKKIEYDKLTKYLNLKLKF